MKAMMANRVHQFGGPEVITFEEIARPVPGPGEVLVRVHAAGVGPWDGWVRSGHSAIAQSLPLTLGSDIAGTVEAVGPGSSPHFSVGQPVFGVTNKRFTGGYAQFAIAHESTVAPAPRNCKIVEAASIPVTAVTAWQMLFQLTAVTAGQRVLVHGAAGNVGAWAVQLAHSAGAIVLASVRGSESLEARALGADDVFELSEKSTREHRATVDVVIDTVGGDSQKALYEYLRPGGTLVSAVSEPNAALAQNHAVRAVFFMVNVTTQDLTRIAELLESDRLTVRVGEVLPLEAARRAHEMLEGSRRKGSGKIVLSTGAERI